MAFRSRENWKCRNFFAFFLIDPESHQTRQTGPSNHLSWQKLRSGSISEENPAAMAANSSTKIVFHFACFLTSLPPALLLLLTLMLLAFNMWADLDLVSQVSIKAATKPHHWMFVETDLSSTVPRIMVGHLGQTHLLMILLSLAYLMLLVGSTWKEECLSLFNLIALSALLRPFFFYCWCLK